jgi:hypothetical protein
MAQKGAVLPMMMMLMTMTTTTTTMIFIQEPSLMINMTPNCT